MRSLVLLLTFTVAFLSCGPAGFQIIVGDEYEDNVTFTLIGSIDNAFQSGSVNVQETLDEYGADIIDSDIGVIEVTIQDYSDPLNNDSFTADATLTIGSTTFTFTNQTFTNGTTVQLNGNNLEDIVANSGNIPYSWDIDAASPFQDNSFSIDISTEIFLTIQVDSL